MKLTQCQMQLGSTTVTLIAWNDQGIHRVNVMVGGIVRACHQLCKNDPNAGVAECLYRTYVGGLGCAHTEREIGQVLGFMCV